MSISILSPLALGLVLGFKHALEADHLAAVSTMATERRGLFASSLIGALWGLGHMLSLVVAGVLVIVFHFEIGEHVGKALELCVGFMLIALGVNSLRTLARGGKSHRHVHKHHGDWHLHPHINEQTQEDRPDTHRGPRLGARPLLVGMVHGLAGSAALTLLVFAAIPSPALGLLYIAIFGIGSIGGMVIMSTLFSLPAKLTSLPFARATLVIRGLAGIVSVCFGVFMVYDMALALMAHTNNS
jgi:cytochrome c biogenesis protein CcdA